MLYELYLEDLWMDVFTAINIDEKSPWVTGGNNEQEYTVRKIYLKKMNIIPLLVLCIKIIFLTEMSCTLILIWQKLL